VNAEHTVTAAHATVVIWNSEQIVHRRSMVGIDHPMWHVQTTINTTLLAYTTTTTTATTTIATTTAAATNYSHMPIRKVWIYRLPFFILHVFVCFLQLWISPPRIKLVASNFARWFTGTEGRESPIFVNFALPEAQNRTNPRDPCTGRFFR